MSRLRSFALFGLLFAAVPFADRSGAAEPAPARVEVYYFHRALRCSGCLDMEAFTAEAVARFPVEREAGRLLFRAVDLDDENNRHFAADYALDFSSVVLSRRANGQEAAWTNLPTVWELAGDKSNFIAYVEMEIAGQLERLPEE